MPHGGPCARPHRPEDAHGCLRPGFLTQPHDPAEPPPSASVATTQSDRVVLHKACGAARPGAGAARPGALTAWGCNPRFNADRTGQETWMPKPNQAACLNGDAGFTRSPHCLDPFASCWSASSPTSVSGLTRRIPRRPRQRPAHCPSRNDQTQAFALPLDRLPRDVLSRSPGSRRRNAPR